MYFLQGGQQIFETKFQDFPGLFELKTPIFPGPNFFFPGLMTAVNSFLDVLVKNKFVPSIANM